MGNPVVARATGPSVGAIAETRAGAPRPVTAATIATAQVLVVASSEAVVAGAVAVVEGST